jgi:hypothetical protein
MPVVHLGDRVDMEVVVALSCVRWWLQALVDADVIEAVPIQQDASGLQLDLLDMPDEHLPLGGCPDRGQIHRRCRICRDEGGSVSGELKVVQIGLQAVTGTDRLDWAIGIVADLTQSVAVRIGHRSPPPRQRRAAAVGLHVEVEPGAARRRGKPHEATPPVEHHQPLLGI